MSENKPTNEKPENPNPEAAADDGGPKDVKDAGLKPPLQAIAVSAGVTALAAAAAAAKYLAG